MGVCGCWTCFVSVTVRTRSRLLTCAYRMPKYIQCVSGPGKWRCDGVYVVRATAMGQEEPLPAAMKLKKSLRFFVIDDPQK